jgi:hypothetical protein
LVGFDPSLVSFFSASSTYMVFKISTKAGSDTVPMTKRTTLRNTRLRKWAIDLESSGNRSVDGTTAPGTIQSPENRFEFLVKSLSRTLPVRALERVNKS